MSERDDAVDRELRDIARTAMAEAELDVDVDADLRVVRERAQTDPGDEAPDAPASSTRWVIWAAAAAVVALLAGGLVVSLRDDTDTVRTAAPPTTEPAPVTTLGETVEPTVTTSAGTAAPTTVPSSTVAPDAAAPAGAPIAVDAASPPPLIEPQPFVSLSLTGDPGAVQVAIGSNGVVVRDAAGLTIVDADGGRRRVDLSEPTILVAAGPGDVVYGLDPYPDDLSIFRLVAVATAGDRTGEVVAFEEVPAVAYTELPVGSFGHGPEGIVDRARDVNATVIGYVDTDGEPIEWSDPPAPLLETTDLPHSRQSQQVTDITNGIRWDLVITPSPDIGDTYLGPSPPAPSRGGRVIAFTSIGPDTTPGEDFGPNEMPVVAVLAGDGTGTWVRLPEDWSVAASDVWGTVLVRIADGLVELARLDDAIGAPTTGDPDPGEPVATDPVAVEPEGDGPVADELAIGVQCLDDFTCTRLAGATDGRIVAYDPVDESLTVLDPSGASVESTVVLAEPIAAREPSFEAVGPDDVAYLAAWNDGDGDPARDLLAVPLGGPNAGVVIATWPGAGGIGDSDLVPTTDGLARVGCCGPDFERPTADAEVIAWVDRAGKPTTFDGPVFRISLRDAGNDLARVDGSETTFFARPTVASNPRGMPPVIATDDGGALMLATPSPGDRSYLVRYRTDWPQYRIDNADVFLVGDSEVMLLEPAGTVIVRDGDRLVRRSLDAVGTAGWPGRTERSIAGDDWTVTAPGLNEYIDANLPAWAADPTTLAYQLRSEIGPNEVFESSYDDAAGVLGITVSGFLDDSVYVPRTSITIERGDDGLYRFVSGTWAQQCQPNRGHQDFRPELCI